MYLAVERPRDRQLHYICFTVKPRRFIKFFELRFLHHFERHDYVINLSMFFFIL